MLQNNWPSTDELQKFKRQISQKEAIERVLETEDGKLLLDHLSDLLLFDIGEFADNANAMFYKEGRRSILTHLLAIKDMDISKYVQEVKVIQVNKLNERM